MSTVVLDASAAVRIVVGPTPTTIVAALETADEVIAPSLFAEEVANALWKYVRANVFTPADAITRLRTALALRDSTTRTTESLLVEALNEACRLGHPVYDLVYLVAARRNAATLVTCDNKLASLASSQGIPVIT